MTDSLPKFDDPPVVETVLGVQFAPIARFSSAHAGWFWHEVLGDEWPTVVETQPVREAFEKFGEEQKWDFKRIHLRPAPSVLRSQFISQDDERMVQLQNTRLHYNWRKQTTSYPSYEHSIGRFEETWQAFVAFCRDAGLDAPEPNQWEVTYINHILKGGLWETVADWNRVIPKLHVPGCDFADLLADNLELTLQMVIGEELGRLHVTLERIRIGGPEGPEAIGLTLTARGPLTEGKGSAVRQGLDLGHSVIVRAFTDMTSEAAHAIWKRRQ